MVAAIDSELTGESFEAAQAVRDALTSQMSDDGCRCDCCRRGD